MCIVVQYAEDWKVVQRRIALDDFDESFDAEKLATAIFDIMMRNKIHPHDVLVAQRDMCFVNGKGLRALLVRGSFKNLYDAGCISHTLDNCGKQFVGTVSNLFWLSFIASTCQSSAAGVLFFDVCHVHLLTYSATRWWSRLMCRMQMYDHFDKLEGWTDLMLKSKVSPETAPKLKAMLASRTTMYFFKTETLAEIIIGEPLMKATYLLEGDHLHQKNGSHVLKIRGSPEDEEEEIEKKAEGKERKDAMLNVDTIFGAYSILRDVQERFKHGPDLQSDFRMRKLVEEAAACMSSTAANEEMASIMEELRVADEELSAAETEAKLSEATLKEMMEATSQADDGERRASTRHRTLSGNIAVVTQGVEAQRKAALEEKTLLIKQATKRSRVAALKAKARDKLKSKYAAATKAQPPRTESQWYSYLNKLCQPVVDYFNECFEETEGTDTIPKLGHFLVLLKSASLFRPNTARHSSKSNAFQLLEALECYPKVTEEIIDELKAEWDTYKAAAMRVTEEQDVLKFFKERPELKYFRKVACLLAVCPASSAAPERVFSLLRHLFGDRQERTLEGTTRTSCMLKWNNREI